MKRDLKRRLWLPVDQHDVGSNHASGVERIEDQVSVACRVECCAEQLRAGHAITDLLVRVADLLRSGLGAQVVHRYVLRFAAGPCFECHASTLETDRCQRVTAA